MVSSALESYSSIITDELLSKLDGLKASHREADTDYPPANLALAR
jgi:hypothetical protein